MPYTIATPSNAYHRPSSFSAVFVKPSGGKYQTLGAIRDASLSITDYESLDSVGRNKINNASSFKASFKMMQASLTELELLDTITDGTNDFIFKMADAAAIPTAGAVATEGWVLVTSTMVNARVMVDYSGDPQSNAFIQVDVEGSFLNTSKDAVVKASIDDDEFEATGDAGTLHAIGTYTAAKDGGLPTSANIKSCGVSALTLAFTGGAAATMGKIKNAKITAAFVGDSDDLARPCPTQVDLNIEYDSLETDPATLLLLDNNANSEIDAVVTMRSGVVFTLANRVGISTDFRSEGDFSKTRIIHFSHKGKILKTAFDGIVS